MMALECQIRDEKATTNLLVEQHQVELDNREAELARWKAEVAKRHQTELDNLRRHIKELLAKEQKAKEEIYNR